MCQVFCSDHAPLTRIMPINADKPRRKMVKPLKPYLKILRPKKSKEKTGLGNTAFQDIQNPCSNYYDPTFPKAVRIGKRAIGHYEHELDIWLQNCPRVTRNYQDTLQESQPVKTSREESQE